MMKSLEMKLNANKESRGFDKVGSSNKTIISVLMAFAAAIAVHFAFKELYLDFIIWSSVILLMVDRNKEDRNITTRLLAYVGMAAGFGIYFYCFTARILTLEHIAIKSSIIFLISAVLYFLSFLKKNRFIKFLGQLCGCICVLQYSILPIAIWHNWFNSPIKIMLQMTEMSLIPYIMIAVALRDGCIEK